MYCTNSHLYLKCPSSIPSRTLTGNKLHWSHNSLYQPGSTWISGSVPVSIQEKTLLSTDITSGLCVSKAQHNTGRRGANQIGLAPFFREVGVASLKTWSILGREEMAKWDVSRKHPYSFPGRVCACHYTMFSL